jgi:CheY-like chemotaxis protein
MTDNLDLPKGMHILIADSSAVVRSFLSRELGKSGALISLADDGEQAFDLASSGDIDLVIADVDLPRIGGIELCRKIKTNQHTQQIPVVILDSLNTDDGIQRGYQAGATACIPRNSQRSLSSMQ